MNSKYIEAIKASRLSIYDKIDIGDSKLWIPSNNLEEILNNKLSGISLSGLALRTRSKVMKQHICTALGYPIPNSFKKTQPRFIGQNFDTYAQKTNNLQVWNEELSPSRRYVIVKVDEDSIITKVKVVTGGELAHLDTTGTLTQKYQARLETNSNTTELIVNTDTEVLIQHVLSGVDLSDCTSPVAAPETQMLLPISEIYQKLSDAIGITFPDAGIDQERNRGGALHKKVCDLLGYQIYKDDGRFPDVRHQLLEVKLQTSPTIDLGLIQPSSEELLDTSKLGSTQIRHCDVRYALFYGTTDGENVSITNLYVTTGTTFFDRFPRFGGKVLNKKLQITLPSNFFSC